MVARLEYSDGTDSVVVCCGAVSNAAVVTSSASLDECDQDCNMRLVLRRERRRMSDCSR